MTWLAFKVIQVGQAWNVVDSNGVVYKTIDSLTLAQEQVNLIHQRQAATGSLPLVEPVNLGGGGRAR